MTPEEYNQREMAEGRLTWEMITELARLWQHEHGLLVDGKLGPATQATLAPPPPEPAPADWTPWDGPLSRQPKNRSEVYEMFGTPGYGKADPLWERENIIELHGRTRLPGVPEQWYVKLNKAIEPYVREGLRRAQLSSDYVIDRFGGYVFRRQRNDPSMPLSMHSWGIAFDVDPARNSARQYQQGAAPAAWSQEWMQIWPDGVDEPFVRALESCGFTWGGRWPTFKDPMHFEWTGDALV